MLGVPVTGRRETSIFVKTLTTAVPVHGIVRCLLSVRDQFVGGKDNASGKKRKQKSQRIGYTELAQNTNSESTWRFGVDTHVSICESQTLMPHHIGHLLGIAILGS